MLGMSPHAVMQTTLPELKYAMRGFERAHGTDPDVASAAKPRRLRPMDRDRLNTLLERYG